MKRQRQCILPFGGRSDREARSGPASIEADRGLGWGEGRTHVNLRLKGRESSTGQMMLTDPTQNGSGRLLSYVLGAQGQYDRRSKGGSLPPRVIAMERGNSHGIRTLSGRTSARRNDVPGERGCPKKPTPGCNRRDTARPVLWDHRRLKREPTSDKSFFAKRPKNFQTEE